MAKIYADLLIAGRKTWGTIPTQVKEPVRFALKQYVLDNHITAETYKEIVGEDYVA